MWFEQMIAVQTPNRRPGRGGHTQPLLQQQQLDSYSKLYQHLQVGVPYMVPLQGVTENHPLGFKDGTPLKVLV